MKVNNCPFCNSKGNVYPFVSQYEIKYEPKHLFGRYYLFKSHTKEIPKLWTAECSNWCDDWLEKYNEKDSVIAREYRNKAIEEWNKWTEEVKNNDHPC